ncbi:unnamed protein product [Didymodactylos carnosus]|uniref:Uncharacterized protein n=1 Tax=Didymodactylos carnosus TaxID=1234261 RepID=A0A815QF76_9BILA|nr:unnamed protein product [Didymodactylos carnosus]CAF1462498.1 unnamed protein product [Didymodactylos carnosus]CAF3550523.1 unnamed protein product [Didymodactylos carnosus]CAF4332443.1 unnamed protein product [Didymodactylos carnosus]
MMYTQRPTFYYHHHHHYTGRNIPSRVDRGLPYIYNQNQFWYSFRRPGLIFGSIILLLSATMFFTEVGRLYSGSNNRGDSNDRYLYEMYPNNIVGQNGVQNVKPENRWFWPWSTATLLFGLVFIATGIMGIISGKRLTYTSILAYLILSILSLFLLVFIIASYSTIITGWYKIYNTRNGNLMPVYARIDRDLSIVCLSLACALTLCIFIGAIVAGLAIQACRKKGSSTDQFNDKQILAPGTPQMGIPPRNYPQRPYQLN